jgi:hypothetical protein
LITATTGVINLYRIHQLEQLPLSGFGRPERAIFLELHCWPLLIAAVMVVPPRNDAALAREAARRYMLGPQ